MANATNSSMNIPNTFNLTGTWQNNIDPITNRNNPVQSQQLTRGLSNNNLPANNNPAIVQNNDSPISRQNNAGNSSNPNIQTSLSGQAVPQNFSNNQSLQQPTLSVNGNLQNGQTSTCTNCQNSDAQTLSNFARSQIGKNTTVEFLIGENTLIEKSGNIVSVGENYILLNETGTRSLVACDLNNIKFIYFDY